MFGLSQSRVNRWLQRLLPIVKHALEELGVLPGRVPEQFAEQERDQQEAAELIIDGTDRRRQRPKNKVKQALHYSGKHKTHSDKNLVVVNAKTKRVGYLSQTYAGKMHDKKIVDTEPTAIPPTRSCIRTPVFRGMSPKCDRRINRKKATQRDVNPGTKAPQSQAVTGPRSRGACPCGGETLPHCEGGLAQYQRGIVRSGNGRCLWLTQSPRALPQAAAANMRKSYFDNVY